MWYNLYIVQNWFLTTTRGVKLDPVLWPIAHKQILLSGPKCKSVCVMAQSRITLTVNILANSRTFKTALGYESGDLEGLIYEKTRGLKSYGTVPLMWQEKISEEKKKNNYFVYFLMVETPDLYWPELGKKVNIDRKPVWKVKLTWASGFPYLLT